MTPGKAGLVDLASVLRQRVARDSLFAGVEAAWVAMGVKGPLVLGSLGQLLWYGVSARTSLT